MNEKDLPRAKGKKGSKPVIDFPHSRSKPGQSPGGFRDLGLSLLAREAGMIQPNLKGHWCSRCRGIWFGFVGEAECPVCGNRHG